MADILRLDLSSVQQGTDFDLNYQDDEEDDESSEQMEIIDPLSDIFSPEDNLPPLKRILGLYTSESSEERQLSTRLIPEAVSTCSSPGDFKMLVMVTMALAGDHYHVVRIGAVSVVPTMMEGNCLEGGTHCMAEKERELMEENQRQLSAIPIKLLTDSEQEVRRVSQTVIINLLSGDVPWKEMVLDNLFPVIKRCLGKDENYDLRMDSAVLISKLASLVKKDIFLKYFSSVLPTLANDTMFHVRKAFAISCGELCSVLGEELTEEHVLPLFLKLCVDEVWGVRKACGDVFTDVSHACNLGTRYDKLTPTFLKLLHDESRWVRKAAYQSLGTFISTFHVAVSSSDQSLDGETSSKEEEGEASSSSQDNLGDTTIRENSHSLDCSNTSATAKDSNHRHTPPDTSSSLSNSSTPIRNSPTQYGSNSESATWGGGDHLELDSSPISKPSDDGVSGTGSSEEDSRGNAAGGGQAKGRLEFESKKESHSSNSLDVVNEKDKDVSGSSNLGNEKVSDSNISAADGGGEAGHDTEPSLSNSSTPDSDADTAEACSSAESMASNNSSVLEIEEESGRSEEQNPVPGSGSTLDSSGRDSCVQKSTVGLVTESEIVNEQRESPCSENTSAVSDCASSDSKSDSVSSLTSSSSPSNSTSTVATDGGDKVAQLPAIKSVAADVRLRSSSAGAAMRRVSVESGLSPRQREAVMADMNEGKKRRWSLDRPHMYNNNNLPQIRVFVHSTTGHVVEQDLSATSPTKKEAEPTAESSSPEKVTSSQCQEAGSDSVGGAGSEGSSAHNCTMDNSVAMEMTLTETEVETTVDERKVEGEEVLEEVIETPYIEQEIVPDELMEIYLSMTEHNRVQAVDSDLLYYCAYSLPGVMMTLGHTHWGLLRPTFNYLAEDMQWKIRRVLAFSLHEMARILGKDITRRDILPVFEEYCTKDIDDVKIGTLTHLAEFFELLPPTLREHHLPRILDGLMQLENQKNWRYRNILAEQLLRVSDLFDWIFLYDHIYPVALLLSRDKVSEVRNSANLLIGALIQKLNSIEKCISVLHQLRSTLTQNSSWLQRLMFVKQCETFLSHQHITCELFASECLPTLLHLARDKVPNVRIAIAKLFKDSIMNCAYFQSDRNGTFSLESLQVTLECLQHDADRDVKFFAGGEIPETRKLMGASQQWYAQRMRSESHTSSDYQDASEYLDLDLVPSSVPLIHNDGVAAATSGDSNSTALDDSSTNQEGDGDDEDEIDDKNVGIRAEDDPGASEDDGFANLKSEKLEVASCASPLLSGDSVTADDAGSTGNSSNESL